MNEHELKTWRSSLRPLTPLSLQEAGEALPHGDVAWVRRHVSPSGEVNGHAIYLWRDVMEAAGIPLQEEGSKGGGPLYISHKEAAKRLGIGMARIRAAMAITPEGKRPWVNTGTEERPRYRWRPAELQSWWEEMPVWRVSEKRKRAAIKSSGEKGGGGLLSDRKPSTPKRKRRSIKERSKQQSSGGRKGRLSAMIQTLPP